MPDDRFPIRFLLLKFFIYIFMQTDKMVKTGLTEISALCLLKPFYLETHKLKNTVSHPTNGFLIWFFVRLHSYLLYDTLVYITRSNFVSLTFQNIINVQDLRWATNLTHILILKKIWILEHIPDAEGYVQEVSGKTQQSTNSEFVCVCLCI